MPNGAPLSIRPMSAPANACGSGAPVTYFCASDPAELALSAAFAGLDTAMANNGSYVPTQRLEVEIGRSRTTHLDSAGSFVQNCKPVSPLLTARGPGGKHEIRSEFRNPDCR